VLKLPKSSMVKRAGLETVAAVIHAIVS
jgi:hypothetical protein